MRETEWLALCGIIVALVLITAYGLWPWIIVWGFLIWIGLGLWFS